MGKYSVELRLTEIYGIEVEAESDRDAVDIAWDLFDKMTESEKNNCHFDSDSDSWAYEI